MSFRNEMYNVCISATRISCRQVNFSFDIFIYCFQRHSFWKTIILCKYNFAFVKVPRGTGAHLQPEGGGGGQACDQSEELWSLLDPRLPQCHQVNITF